MAAAFHHPLAALERRLVALEEGTGAVWLHGFPSQGLSEEEARLLYWAMSVTMGSPAMSMPRARHMAKLVNSPK